jgi:hypothetical protein
MSAPRTKARNFAVFFFVVTDFSCNASVLSSVGLQLSSPSGAMVDVSLLDGLWEPSTSLLLVAARFLKRQICLPSWEVYFTFLVAGSL